MLTPSDGRGDSALVRYLEQPRTWRAFDQDLYDFLVRHVLERGERNVRLIERSKLLPATFFHTSPLGDEPIERGRYFREMLERFRGADLIFLDPDNGFEVNPNPTAAKSPPSSYTGARGAIHTPPVILSSSTSTSHESDATPLSSV